jgi:imidazole glycerol-phosphate synthase subunit HisF
VSREAPGMLPNRVIPCLDVHAGQVVKGTEFVNLQEVGDPVALASRYEAEGADELVLLDVFATSERRSTMIEVVRRTASEVSIPFTVGGGIRSETDAQNLLDAGADKIAVNSAALAEPALINRLAARFGGQCVVLAVDAKSDGQGSWKAYASGGKVATGKEVTGWTREAVLRGAGEILLTSIDRDGTGSGYDLPMIRSVTDQVGVPVIASGGAGRTEHYQEAILEAGAEAVLVASELHYGRMTVGEIKASLAAGGLPIRPAEPSGEQVGPSAARPALAIVDYGVGNRYSVRMALERIGAKASVTAGNDELTQADGIVLPGVGTFQAAMDRLQSAGLDTVLRRLAAVGKPILGICLGEQLLFDGSEEAGWREGLGLIGGRVLEIETPVRPNMGWRQVNAKGSGNYFYHAHRYAVRPASEETVTGWTSLPYGADPDYRIPGMVRRGNILGVQFHPEKSGIAGLRLLRDFAEISAGDQARL